MTVALAYTIANDARWAGAQGEAAPDRFYPERFLTSEGAEQVGRGWRHSPGPGRVR